MRKSDHVIAGRVQKDSLGRNRCALSISQVPYHVRYDPIDGIREKGVVAMLGNQAAPYVLQSVPRSGNQSLSCEEDHSLWRPQLQFEGCNGRQLQNQDLF